MSNIIKGASFDKVQYYISLRIKDKDYSADLNRVRLVSSINSPYQILNLELFMDSNDIILTKLYGQDPIKLSIKLTREQSFVSEQLDFELMMIRNDLIICIVLHYD